MNCPTALVRVDGASYDQPAAFLVSLTPRVLRALALLAETQAYYGDGTTIVVAPSIDPGAAAGGADEDLIDHVVLSGADADQQQQLRDWIDTAVAKTILEGA